MSLIRFSPMHSDIQKYEDRFITRTIAEVQWLLITLVLFYFVVKHAYLQIDTSIISVITLYGILIAFFHYTKILPNNFHLKVGIETGLMLCFVTWVVCHTGMLNSPLVNLFLLIIVTSALALGKTTTLLHVILISAIFCLIGAYTPNLYIFSGEYAIKFTTHLVPFLMVAYLTTMIREGIQNTKDKMSKLAETDELTKLHNMRGFYDLIEAELLRAERYKRKFSILMVDSDNLKDINDAYGHKLGDQLIRNTAMIIKNTLRCSDVVARYGGDEFIVLLVETDAEGAKIAAEQIRKQVESLPLKFKGEDIPTTVSIGASTFPENAKDLPRLISEADKALYHCKIKGKNQSKVVSEGDIAFQRG